MMCAIVLMVAVLKMRHSGNAHWQRPGSHTLVNTAIATTGGHVEQRTVAANLNCVPDRGDAIDVACMSTHAHEMGFAPNDKLLSPQLLSADGVGYVKPINALTHLAL